MLYANVGHAIEAVVAGVTGTPKVSGSSTIQASAGPNNTLMITGTPSGISTINGGKTIIIIVDKPTALSFWNVQLPSVNATVYDKAPDVPSVFVFGPYLVRNATLSDSDSVLALHGDINATTTIDVITPPSVKRLTWNGAPVNVQKSNLGTLRGTLPFSAQTPSLPSLKAAKWACTDSLPEIQAGFDDSEWITANKTSTARPYQPFSGKVSRNGVSSCIVSPEFELQYVLYADEYGFHQGMLKSRVCYSSVYIV